MARRLLEYKKFKEIANNLQEKEEVMKNYFPRLVDEEDRKRLIDEEKEVCFEVSLFDLITAFSEALTKVPEESFHEIIQENFTVEQKVDEVLHLLSEKGSFILKDFFLRANSKVEIVVIFLAVLELIRQRKVNVVQGGLFSDINITHNRNEV